MEFDLYGWIILPLLIFLARIGDVSIGTVRLILLSRGARLWAPLLGFFEVLIWLLAIGHIMKNLNNVACYAAYAGGFATGNYIGMLIESRLRLGVVLVRIIALKDATELADQLRERHYGVTALQGQGKEGPVHILFTIVRRTGLEEVIETVQRLSPQAVFSVEDVRAVSGGVFPPRATGNPLYLFRRVRKGK